MMFRVPCLDDRSHGYQMYKQNIPALCSILSNKISFGVVAELSFGNCEKAIFGGGYFSVALRLEMNSDCEGDDKYNIFILQFSRTN